MTSVSQQSVQSLKAFWSQLHGEMQVPDDKFEQLLTGNILDIKEKALMHM